MHLTNEEIKKIAHLSRIDIPESQFATISGDLTKILAFVEQLNAADTKSVKPVIHSLDANTNFREDLITEPNQRDLLQSIAPLTENGLYLVPLVIE